MADMIQLYRELMNRDCAATCREYFAQKVTKAEEAPNSTTVPKANDTSICAIIFT